MYKCLRSVQYVSLVHGGFAAICSVTFVLLVSNCLPRQKKCRFLKTSSCLLWLCLQATKFQLIMMGIELLLLLCCLCDLCICWQVQLAWMILHWLTNTNKCCPSCERFDSWKYIFVVCVMVKDDYMWRLSSFFYHIAWYCSLVGVTTSLAFCHASMPIHITQTIRAAWNQSMHAWFFCTWMRKVSC